MVVKPLYLFLAVGLAGALVALAAVSLFGHSSTVTRTRTVMLVGSPDANAAFSPAELAQALSTAQANVRSAIPAIEAYAADHDNSYVGASLSELRDTYDDSLEGFAVVRTSQFGYCIESNVNGQVVSKDGPSAEIVGGGCAAPSNTALDLQAAEA